MTPERPAALQITIGDWQIRGLRADDRESLQKYANNSRISAFTSDRFPYPYTLADADAFLERTVGQDPESTFAIAVEEELIGAVGLELQEDVSKHSAELGYWLAEPFWGRGIVTRAVEEIVEYGFSELGLVRIYARAYANNPASRRVLEKNGFDLEGRLKKGALKRGELLDVLVYARLAPDGESLDSQVADGD